MVCAPFISLWPLKAKKTSRSHKRDTSLLLPDFLELETSAWLTGTYLHVEDSHALSGMAGKQIWGFLMPQKYWQRVSH